MIPAYIIDSERKKQEEQTDNRISLEIPDYSAEYEEWMRRKKDESGDKQSETVIVIDIY